MNRNARFRLTLVDSLSVRSSTRVLSDQGCISQIFTGGGGRAEFRLAMTDRATIATIAGMEVAKLVPWNSLLN